MMWREQASTTSTRERSGVDWQMLKASSTSLQTALYTAGGCLPSHMGEGPGSNPAPVLLLSFCSFINYFFRCCVFLSSFVVCSVCVSVVGIRAS